MAEARVELNFALAARGYKMGIAHDGPRGHVAVDHVLPGAVREVPIGDDVATGCRPPQRRLDAFPRQDVFGGETDHLCIVRMLISCSK
jgi:hypothetical protein